MTAITQQHVGNYRLVKKIASGGSGTIWKAIATGGNQTNAIKLLHGNLVGDSQHVQALQNEFKIGSLFDNKGVLRYHQYGVFRQAPYIVMELFPSVTLKRLIEDPQKHDLRARVRAILYSAAKTLAYVHTQRVVHRDIKPDNILVDEKNETRLIDFSIAFRAKPITTVLLEKVFRGNKKKQTAGTPSYMAPEQIRGEAVSPAADIYSFGASMYEVLTGRPPFEADNPTTLLQMALEKPPKPMRKLSADINPKVDQLVLSMLSKDIADRPLAMAGVAGQLRQLNLFLA